jgi:two-component system sensor histidine kinase KdpD
VINHQLIIADYEQLPPVIADKQRIAQVLINLVGNAAKYSPPGKPITISFTQKVNTIEVTVSNEGPTIPIQDRERVFAAFLQLTEPLNKQKNRGAGLGLAICKGLIEAHGGHIWIADQSVPGTTVAFTLPIAGGKRPFD